MKIAWVSAIAHRVCACDALLHNLDGAASGLMELGGYLVLTATADQLLPVGSVYVADWALSWLQRHCQAGVAVTAVALTGGSRRERKMRVSVRLESETRNLRDEVVLRAALRQLRVYAGTLREGHVVGVSVAGVVVAMRVVALLPTPGQDTEVVLAEEDPLFCALQEAMEQCYGELLLPRLQSMLANAELESRLVVVAGRGMRVETMLFPVLAHRLRLKLLVMEGFDAIAVEPNCLVAVTSVDELREGEASELRDWLARLSLVQKQIAVLVTSSLSVLPGDLRAGCVPITVRPPDREQRAMLLKALEKESPADEETIDSTGGFSVEDLEQLATVAVAEQRGWAEARVVVRPRLLAEASWSVPNARVAWEDVVGCEHVRAALERGILWPLRHPDLMRKFGCSVAGGILLYGPSGCGKSLSIAAFATSSRINLLQVSAAQVLSKYTGETEAQIRQLFAHCRSLAPCVLCFDDFDQLASSRDAEDTEEDTGGALQRVVSTLLNELDGVDTASGTTGVFFVALCNRPWALDSAILRPGRIDTMVYVGPPDEAARRRLLGDDSRLVAETEGFSHAAVMAYARGSRALARLDGAGLSKYETFACSRLA